MGTFYFDDTIQHIGEFVLGGLIYSKEGLNDRVSDALLKYGFTPGQDEYKSGTYMRANNKMAELREELHKILIDHTQIAVAVLPLAERKSLGVAGLHLLSKVITNNYLGDGPHTAYFDEGMFNSDKEVSETVAELDLHKSVIFHAEQNSKAVLGLQLADLVAHTCGLMLRDSLGLLKKTVKAVEDSGYEPGLEIDLGFVLWARIRYCFFHAHSRLQSDKEFFDAKDFTVDVKSCGLHIAKSCSAQLKEAAETRFGTMYLGCIH